MRMWMVNPKIMCRKHLLGEHVEHHMFAGSINKGINVAGYLAKNLLEPASLWYRHDILSREMLARGYRHQSELPEINWGARPGGISMERFLHEIDREAALGDLLERCPECHERFKDEQR